MQQLLDVICFKKYLKKIYTDLAIFVIQILKVASQQARNK